MAAQGTTVTVCACVLALVSVSGLSAKPVYPVVDLDQMPSFMSCLFICNVCFDNEPLSMMRCANDACRMTDDSFLVLRLLRLGHQCPHFDRLESIFADDSEGKTDQEAVGEPARDQGDPTNH